MTVYELIKGCLQYIAEQIAAEDPSILEKIRKELRETWIKRD